MAASGATASTTASAPRASRRTARLRRLLLGRWGVPLCYALLLVVVYAPVVFLGRTLQAPAYYPHGLVPNAEAATAAPTFNIDLATPAYYEWPVNVLVGRLWREGELPLWNPYQGAGAPLATQYSSRAFFPYQVLQNLLPVQTWDFFTLGRLWVAGTLTFWFLRAARLSALAAGTGGLLYMLSGAFTWFINLEQMANVAMVLPGLLLAVEWFWRGRWTSAVALTALTTALVLVAGQPETALFALILAASYGLARLATTRPLVRALRVAGGAGFGVGLGFALAAPLLLPFLDTMREAHNIHPPGGEIAMASPTAPLYALALLVPGFFEARTHARILPDNGIWDTLGGYSGTVALLLVAVGLVSLGMPGPRRARLLLLTFSAFAAVTLLKNFGMPWAHALGRLPLLDQAWSQRWAGPTWTFAIACAAAAGIECVRDWRRSLRVDTSINWSWSARALAVPIALFLLALVVRVGQLVRDYHAELPAEAVDYLRLAGWLGLAVALGFAAAVVLVVARFLPLGRALLALPALAALELWYVVPRGYGVEERTLLLIPLALGAAAVACVAWSRMRTALALAGVAALASIGFDALAVQHMPARGSLAALPAYAQFVRNEAPYARVTGVEGLLMPNFASAAGLNDVHYITALEPEPFHLFRSRFLQVEPVFSDSSSSLWFTGLPQQDVAVAGGGVRVTRPAIEDFASRLPYYSLLGVRYLVAPHSQQIPAETPLREVRRTDEAIVYENPAALPRAFVVHEVAAAPDMQAAFDWLATNFRRFDSAAVVEANAPPVVQPAQPGSGSTATIRRLTANTVEVQTQTSAAGLLVLTDVHDNGWRVTVDGADATLYRTNGAFRGVAVEAGTHTVVFRYRPASFMRGVQIAGAAGLTVLALLAAGYFASRSAPARAE